MATTETKIDANILKQYYDEVLRQQIASCTEWENLFGNYRVPDNRTRLQKVTQRIYWSTIGRFKAWLHRDCGEY